MAVTVVEVQTSAVGASTPTVTLASTPAAGDILVAMWSGSGATTMSSVSGMGATWTTPVGISDAGVSQWFAMGTGATTAGAVTGTLSTAKNGGITVYLVRGLPSGSTMTTATVTAASGTGITGPTQSADAGSFVCSVMGVDTNTLTWPATQTPSGAWTAETLRTGSFHSYQAGRALPTSTASYSTTGTAGNFTNKRITQAVIAGAGTTAVSLTGEVSTVTLAAPAGTLNIPSPADLTGEVSTVTLSAPAGTVDAGTPAALTGDFVYILLGAPPGTVAVTPVGGPVALTGDVSLVTLGAPVGTVTAGGEVALTGEVSTVTLGSPVGSVATTAPLAGAGATVAVSGPGMPAGVAFGSLQGAQGAVAVSGRVLLGTDHVVDPLTRTPQYQLIVVKPDGTRLGELNKAQALSPLEHDFAGESWDFAMPAHDPKTALTLGARREIQVWRGGQLLRWGPIIKRSGDDVQVRISCGSVRWYLDQKAVIGKLPKTDLLVNGDFSEGEKGWSFGYDPTSIPALPPLHSIVAEGADGSNALKISGADESQLVTTDVATEAVFEPNSATYLSGGEAHIQAVGNNIPAGSTVRLTGHTANDGTGSGLTLSLNRAKAAKATLAAMGKGFVFALADTSHYAPGTFVTGDNCVGRGYYSPISSSLAPNRRVTIAYEGLLPADGHRQYAYQRLYYMVPEAARWPMQVVFIGTIKILDFVASSKDGWSVYIHRVNPSNRAEVLDYGTAPLDKDTPRGVWIKQECSIEVPADGVTYELEVRFYPPSGDALWDRGGLFPAERLGFVDVRQEHIIEHLVEHAQDPAVGNDNLFILNRPAFSGITRQRRYDFHERRSVGDAINDFMALDDGLEVDMEFTPTQKFLTSYYPRKGQDTGLTLSCPGKIMRFDVQEDATQVGNVAVVRADGSGPGQEESYAIDADALDGLRLQRTFNAEQEMPAWELGQAADRQLARFRTPPLLWSITCDPKWTSWLLDRVKLGDTVRCVIDAGWAKIDGPVRIVGESLDPATDAITYDIDVEV